MMLTLLAIARATCFAALTTLVLVGRASKMCWCRKSRTAACGECRCESTTAQCAICNLGSLNSEFMVLIVGRLDVVGSASRLVFSSPQNFAFVFDN